MVNVAILYETGEGTARSLPDAYAWYRAAARRGDTAAAERALDLFRSFSGADKAQAVLMAAAVAEAMLEPTAAPRSAILPATAAVAAPPAVLKPAPRRNSGAARDAGPARRQPAG
jgi:TPR repeat protein